MSKEEKSLLELAIEYIEKRDEPQNINEVIDYVVSEKNIKKAELEDVKAQLIMDFMLSGNFVYCKDDCWDLKYRQSTSVLDKDGGDYSDFYTEEDEEVRKNELSSDNEMEYDSELGEFKAVEDDDEEDQEDQEDIEDLSNDFDN